MATRNSSAPNRMEARFYERAGWDNVLCRLCPLECAIAPSRHGACGIRGNRDGTLFLEFTNRVTTREVVLGEHLPLYHYKPDIDWLLLGGKGCTMRCPFCNTWRQSQSGATPSTPLDAEGEIAVSASRGIRGVSFGVSEPAPMQEFLEVLFPLAKGAGLDTHVATSGMWNPEPLRDLVPHLGAATIGLKGYDSAFYRSQLGGELEVISHNIELLTVMGVHVEISWLVIPGVTDQPDQVARFRRLAEALTPVPVVILIPYHPAARWDSPAAATLADLQRVHALFDGYPMNVYEQHPDSAAQNTCCSKCARPLIRRGLAGLIITSEPSGRPKSTCPTCGTPVPYRLGKV